MKVAELVDHFLILIGPFLMATLGFPIFVLLIVSKRAQQFWFSIIFPPLIARHRVHFEDILPTLFADLTDRDNQETETRILEIGTGPANNFKWFPKNSKIVGLDLNPFFRKFAEANAIKHNCKLEQFIVGGAEDLSAIESESVDVAIATHVLCSVDSPEAVVRELHRVLKPNGKFFLLEHVANRSNNWIYRFQQAIEPFHSVLAANCRVTRDTQLILNQNGFATDQLKYLEVKHMPMTLAPTVFGVAVKK
jgi:SAM-dependent methyltransferase